MFCMQCGSQNHNTTNFCSNCGAEISLSSSLSPSSSTIRGNGANDLVPAGIKGWSWGAFFLNWIWAIGNRTWWGLLAIIPYVGFIVAIWLGFKGRELAWKNGKWDSVEHFNRVQRLWSIWGVVLVFGVMMLGVFAAIAIPAYQKYVERAKTVNVEPAFASELPLQAMNKDAWEQQLAQVAQEVNSHLPEKVDAITTMNKVVAGPGRTFTYMYTLDVEKHHVAVGQLDAFRESVADKVCDTLALQPFFDQGTTIVYHYVDKNNRKVTEINIAPTYCNNRKADQFQRFSKI